MVCRGEALYTFALAVEFMIYLLQIRDMTMPDSMAEINSSLVGSGVDGEISKLGDLYAEKPLRRVSLRTLDLDLTP